MSHEDTNALFQQAVQLHHAGKLADAQSIYREILTADPLHTDTQYLYAASLLQTHRTQESIALLKMLLEQNPNHFDAHATLAEAYLSENSLEDAIAHFEKSVTLNPKQPKVFTNLGTAWQRANDVEKAMACFGHSLQLNPNSPDTHYNLGNLLREMGQYDAAITCYQNAAQLNPGFAKAHSNLGYTLKATGRLAAALAAFERAHQLQPDNAAIHSGIVYLMQFALNKSPEEILDAHTHWFNLHAAHLTQNILPHTNDLSPARRLRIGYVSPDFRNHCQSFFTIPLLENHNHEQFEIHLYAHVLQNHPITERIKKTADRWHPTTDLTDEQLTQKIREDQIDILVDLTMHMASSRLLTFAQKPAPIQITWLAYPGTTGIPTIDYRFSDPYLDPSGADTAYTEKTIRLPETFWCYDPLTETPAPNARPYQTNGYITFGCLNNFCKVNDEVMELWSQVLTDIPTAHLLVLCPEGQTRADFLNFFAQRNIASSRIEFTGALTREKYLALYHRIDIALDTFPYNGHTTTLDGLWMGVPVVTLVGKTIVGRAGFSQLTNLHLEEFIAHTKAEYREIARRISEKTSILDELRVTLRQKMKDSPLMDAARFASHIESAYREIWEAHCNKKAL